MTYEPAQPPAEQSKEQSLFPGLILPDTPKEKPSKVTTFRDWPPEWQPIHHQIVTQPTLKPHKDHLNDLEWWQGMAATLQVTPAALEPILVETALYLRTAGYVARSKRSFRQKLRNCLPVAQSRLTSQATRVNGKDPYAHFNEVWTCQVCGQIHETPKGTVRRCPVGAGATA